MVARNVHPIFLFKFLESGVTVAILLLFRRPNGHKYMESNAYRSDKPTNLPSISLSPLSLLLPSSLLPSRRRPSVSVGFIFVSSAGAPLHTDLLRPGTVPARLTPKNWGAPGTLDGASDQEGLRVFRAGDYGR